MPWNRYVDTADSWAIAHAVNANPVQVRMFCGAHAFELYLKACLMKAGVAPDLVMKAGHNLRKLWELCKSNDPKFLPNWELSAEVLDERNHLSGGAFDRLSEDGKNEFISKQDIYVAIAHSADLKYLHTPLKTAKGQIGYAFGVPSEVWRRMFTDLRTYLGAPQRWPMRSSMETKNLSPAEQEWLRPLFGPMQPK